jgi:FAD synthase
MQVIPWTDFTATLFPLFPSSFSSPIPYSLFPIPYSASIGVFDGVHLGHQALISKVVSRGPNPTVITFRQNPKGVLSPETYSGDIIALEEKLALFEKLGITRTILIDFSENFSKLEGRFFIETLLDRGLAFLAVGENFRCGHRLDTDAAAIKRITAGRGVETEVLEPVLFEGERVSSSRIRAAISAGKFEKAQLLLGR